MEVRIEIEEIVRQANDSGDDGALDALGTKGEAIKKFANMNYGHIRAVVEAPEKSIYLLTSNRDGCGNPDSKDGRILRIVA